MISLLPGLACGLSLLLIKRLFGVRRTGYGSTLKQILIIRLDAIGDFVLWLDAAKELRRLYPKEKYTITLLGNSSWSELANRLPYFDDVWPVDRYTLVNSPVSFGKLVQKLISIPFDTVLHPVCSREFLFGDLFVWACAAREKIGMESDLKNEFPWQKRLGNRYYTRLIPCPCEAQTELERNAVFMRGIGLVEFTAGTPVMEDAGAPPLSLPYSAYYVVFPGASVATRRWPVENFATLIERIHAASGMAAVVCGGPAEESLGKALEKMAAGSVVNLVGKTSMRELVSVIAKARFLVGNETGAVHIAAAVGTPSVCVLGGGHFGRFIPYRHDTADVRSCPVPVFNSMDCFGCNWKCIYKISLDEAVPCIRNISLDEVIEAVLELFKPHEAN